MEGNVRLLRLWIKMRITLFASTELESSAVVSENSPKTLATLNQTAVGDKGVLEGLNLCSVYHTMVVYGGDKRPFGRPLLY